MSHQPPHPKYPTFHALYAHLLTLPTPLLPPARPATSPSLTAAISALSLHPTLEAACHILNADLPSAHFLVRHMQAPPAFEGMYLHGILHRVEGDYDNARAWYGNVAGSEVFEYVWEEGGGLDAAKGFIGEVEGLRRRKEGKGEGEAVERLGEKSLWEVKRVVEWCAGRFGEGRWEDATSAWVRPSEEYRKMGEEMTSGGKGFRKF
ncbi:MAG: hypothetical protein Q9185_006697 [Variospora sp. 1 TL-2023]